MLQVLLRKCRSLQQEKKVKTNTKSNKAFIPKKNQIVVDPNLAAENFSSDEGLSDVLKQTRSNTLNLEKEGNRQKESKVLENIFENSLDEASSLNKLAQRSGSFLDRLIRRMESNGGKESFKPRESK